MHMLPPTPLAHLHPAMVGTPGGWQNVGLPRPAGVLPPPDGWTEMGEIAAVRQLNARQDPASVQFTEYLDRDGDFELWMDLAKQYRNATGFVRGWAGTALMLTAMGAATLHSRTAKAHYGRLRPYQVDPAIMPIGKLQTEPSYPSGHATSSAAAATVLSHLWPQRAHEYKWWARQVGLSRMHAGMHFPSDVAAGARLGQRAGLHAASILY